MTKKITAEISLTRAEWASLLFCLMNSTPNLPKECWLVGEVIEQEIQNGLAKAKEEN